MGTIGIIVVRLLSPKPSGATCAKECSTVERWLYRTPLGLPVVPDV